MITSWEEIAKSDHFYWLGFSVFEGIGPKRFALLKNFFGSAKKAWVASSRELLDLGLNQKLVADFEKFRQNFDTDSYLLRLRENKVECLFADDNNYPENLKKIDDPPFALYRRGEIEAGDSLAVAVVGTRKMTGYGGQVTESLTVELVTNGLTIVSGLARGIDTVAHRSAIKANGRTIAVLACGLDIIYPPDNIRLAQEISEGHGAVVSEYPLGMQAAPGNFPARNRIISGLSLGTVVIEGPEDSGAMITARLAAEQGREVFAVPGPITSINSAGPSHLIKIGAKLVWRVSDILDELNIESKAKEKINREVLPESKEEQILLSLLANEAKHVDELLRESGLAVAEVAGAVSLMEMKGLIKNLGNGVYSKSC